MPPTLLVERAFIDDFVATVRQARAHIEVQCMSFEGDQAGALVSRELIKKAAEGVRVRVLIDYFTDLMVSDRPASHPAVAREVRATRRMIRRMEAAGVGVRRTRPLGPLYIRCLIRNHKKLLVVDDAAYIGGINISDHNFAWHDYMVRLDGPVVHGILDDFDATWEGRPHEPDGPLLSGARLRRFLVDGIRRARREVLITAPYLLDAFILDLLLAARRRGAAIAVLTLKQSNFRLFGWMGPYVVRRLLDAGAGVYTYRQFSHAKYLLLDGRTVVFGSSNFNHESLLTKEDLCMHSSDPALVAAFQALAAQALAMCDRHDARISPLQYWSSKAANGAALALIPVYARLFR